MNNIKTWQDRLGARYPISSASEQGVAMRSEIAELRAALKSEHTLAVAAEHEMLLMEKERDEARASLAAAAHQQQEPGAWKCSRCGASTAAACDSVGCHAHEEGEPPQPTQDAVDAVRLDFLEECWARSDEFPHVKWNGIAYKAETLREAIDAAMRSNTAPEG